MREDMVGRVETITGRRVRVFLSANELDPDVAVETFLLESLDDKDEKPARRGQAKPPRPEDAEIRSRARRQPLAQPSNEAGEAAGLRE